MQLIRITPRAGESAPAVIEDKAGLLWYKRRSATLENMEKWAAKVDVPLYAFDDQSAIKVVDGEVEVISEGEWKLFKK
jgi:hypothetical protein